MLCAETLVTRQHVAPSHRQSACGRSGARNEMGVVSQIKTFWKITKEMTGKCKI